VRLHLPLIHTVPPWLDLLGSSTPRPLLVPAVPSLLMWYVFAISTYGTTSVIFGSRPDPRLRHRPLPLHQQSCRNRSTALAAFFWKGTDRDWNQLRALLLAVRLLSDAAVCCRCTSTVPSIVAVSKPGLAHNHLPPYFRRRRGIFGGFGSGGVSLL